MEKQTWDLPKQKEVVKVATWQCCYKEEKGHCVKTGEGCHVLWKWVHFPSQKADFQAGVLRTAPCTGRQATPHMTQTQMPASVLTKGQRGGLCAGGKHLPVLFYFIAQAITSFASLLYFSGFTCGNFTACGKVINNNSDKANAFLLARALQISLSWNCPVLLE